MRFVDEARIQVRAGKGGHGCLSFRREKFVPRGGPDGGNGGDGGSVLLKADGRLLSLYDFRLKRLYEARNGRPGEGSQCDGKKGEDMNTPLKKALYFLDPLRPSCQLPPNGCAAAKPAWLSGLCDCAGRTPQGHKKGEAPLWLPKGNHKGTPRKQTMLNAAESYSSGGRSCSSCQVNTGPSTQT